MARDFYKPAVLLMWLTLPTAAWNYWRVWDQLPARMAVHFNGRGQANGFASREGAVETGLGIMLLILVVFTAVSLILHQAKPVASWAALAIAYVVLSFCWYGNYSIVEFNLKASPAHSELVGTSSPALSDSFDRTVS
ncbi:MAG: DUF1648 domain-containing protein [Candidatus Sulfotelmatobacter sp.]